MSFIAAGAQAVGGLFKGGKKGKKRDDNPFDAQWRTKFENWKAGNWPENDKRFGSTFRDKKTKFEKKFNGGVIIPWGSEKSKSSNNETILPGAGMGSTSFQRWLPYIGGGIALLLGALFIFKKR